MQLRKLGQRPGGRGSCHLTLSQINEYETLRKVLKTRRLSPIKLPACQDSCNVFVNRASTSPNSRLLMLGKDVFESAGHRTRASSARVVG